MRKAVHWRRGEVREGVGGVNPVTARGEHSGVVRGLYKTLSMNGSKHLNDREVGRDGCVHVCVCMCACVWLWVTVKQLLQTFREVSEYIQRLMF